MLRKSVMGALAFLVTSSLGVAASADAEAGSSGTWSRLYTASVPSAAFTSVSGSDAHDAWAVGHANYLDGKYRPPVLAHWDGARWRAAAAPAVAPRATLINLSQVKAVSKDNTWAIGSAMLKGTDKRAGVIAHRTGNRWTTRVLPALSGVSHISVFSANNVWILGSLSNAERSKGTPTYWHWNGKAWTSGTLPAFAAGSSDDAYVVTAVTYDAKKKEHQTLLRYRAGRWVVQSGPTIHPGTGPSGDPNVYSFVGLVRRSDSNIDVSVEYADHDELRPYIDLYHWNGSSWKRSIRVDMPYLSESRITFGLLCGDGAGGVWMLAIAPKFGLVDIRDGKIVAKTTDPIRDELDVFDLTLRPGTRRVWLAGGSDYGRGPAKDLAKIAGYVP